MAIRSARPARPISPIPLEVAAILAEMRLDDATIATALLHDTIEDTATTRSEIDALFGREIGSLVDGLTKIKKLDLVTKKAEQAENFRKLLLAISSDIRVLLVKLADRLHNMRTLEHMKPQKRKIIAEETMDIYAPLAGRMGMQWLREELEDHAFRSLNPEAYSAVVERLKMLRERNQGLIDEIEAALTTKLEEATCRRRSSSGREKKPYAIWSKMERKQISLEQLSDIYAFRIVVPEGRGLLPRARRWCTPPGTPCPAASRTTSPTRSRTTTSRSTPPSSARAISGSSCRSAPSGCIPSPNTAWRRTRSTRTPTASNGKGVVPLARLQRLSLAAPSGRHAARRRQPRGVPRAHQARAVPGSGVLLHAQGAADRAAARRQSRSTSPMRCTPTSATPASAPRSTAVPCRSITELRNGDEVEIICSKAQLPPSAWQSLAVTGKARSAIRRATRDAVRAQYGKLGREILVRAFQRREKTFSEESLARGTRALVAKDRGGCDGGGRPGRTCLSRCRARRLPRGEIA